MQRFVGSEGTVPVVTVRDSSLARATYWAVIFGVVVLTGNSVLEQIRAVASPAVHEGKATLQMGSYANVEGAHLTVTNLQEFTVRGCWKGVVTNRKTKKTIETVPICTGELKPRSTIAITAPYVAANLVDVCPNTESQFGGISWENCDFTTVDVN